MSAIEKLKIIFSNWYKAWEALYFQRGYIHKDKKTGSATPEGKIQMKLAYLPQHGNTDFKL